MANPSRLTLGPLAAAVANGIAQSQTPGAAGNLTLNGSLVVPGPTLFQGVTYTNYAAMDVARRISIASAGADSAVIFTVRGFNRDLQPLTETVTGVATPTAVQTANDFLIVTSVGVSGATAGAITVGTNSVASSAWVLTNIYVSSWALSVAVLVAGTVNYSIEQTYDDLNAAISTPLEGFVVEHNSAVPPVPWSIAATANLTSSIEAQYPDKPVMAVRVTLNSGTGSVAFWVMQSGIIS